MAKRLPRVVRHLVSWTTRTRHHQPRKRKQQQEEEHGYKGHEQDEEEDTGKAQQQPACALLEVPVEITLLIAEKLPLHGQLLLSQTCRALRITLQHHLGFETARWGRNQRAEFLSCLVRQRPDHWACWRCESLHAVDYADSPASQVRQRRSCKSRAGEIFGTRVGSPFRLYHFHVQLALKYTRMARDGLADEGGRRQRHLEKIMEPYHGGLPARSSPSLLVWYSTFPRIVDGRFLLLSVWSFDDEDGEATRHRDVLRFLLPLCPHRNYHDLSSSIRKRRKQLLMDRHCALCRSIGGPAPTSPVRIEVHDACPNCRTDFSVQGSQMCSVLRCWQDLGPEASPRNRVWRSRADMLEDIRLPSVYHAPGSVRALYESVDGVLGSYDDKPAVQSSRHHKSRKPLGAGMRCL